MTPFIFVICLLVTLTRCDPEVTRSEENRRFEAIPLTSPRPAPPHPIYDFAKDIFLKTLELDNNSEENVLISPFSIRAILALIYLAANGNTAKEIRDALHFSSDPDRVISGLGKHMQQAESQPGQNYLFKIGNGIFVQKGVVFNRTFTDIAQHKLRSTVTVTDFQNPEGAARDINEWVAAITENRIPDLIDSDSLSPATTVFLGNALFFSGQWNKPFDGSVAEAQSKFWVTPENAVTVPMMQVESIFPYAYISKLRATGISIPFKDQRFEFIVLKPEGTLQELEYELRDYPLNGLATDIKRHSRNVVLKMPKFRLDVNHNLKRTLRQLGITSLFQANAVDLSGLTKGQERHVVGQIVHRTTLEINEKGATAAAATGVEIYPISSPSIFAIDKPFLFMINDRLTGPVLIGHLVNPSQTIEDY